MPLDLIYQLLKKIEKTNFYDKVIERSVIDEKSGIITSLDLSYLEITVLPKGLFEKFHSLKILDLSFNHISKIYGDTFEGLYKLENLQLSLNDLEIIDKDSFKSLRSLKQLFLSGNELCELDPLTFSCLKNLEILNLGQYFEPNKFEKLHQDLFRNLSNLKYLAIADCKLHELAPNQFSDLIKLEELNLCCNKFVELHDSLLNNQTELKQLELSDNLLTDLPNSIWKLYKLEFLNLKGNSLENSWNKSFKNHKVTQDFIKNKSLNSYYKHEWPHIAIRYLFKLFPLIAILIIILNYR